MRLASRPAFVYQAASGGNAGAGAWRGATSKAWSTSPISSSSRRATTTVVDEVLELFREQSAIWGAMLTPANDGWRDGVHTLKGAARGVGAFQLGDACEACEAAGSGGLDQVRDALDATLADIAAYAHERALKSLKTPGRPGLTRVLLIKTSSLGDVIHCLPAVSDMVREVPDLTLDWVIEEQLAEIARLHPAVDRAIPVRLRSWRRRLFDSDTWTEFGAFRHAISQKRYDRIIDAQGLIRSALLARLAAGPHCGYDRKSVREPPASLFYDRKFEVSVTIHAVERMRRLAAQAMGYEPPTEIDYGLDVVGERPQWLTADRYIVGLHATARADKTWPEERLARARGASRAAGLALVLPWGSENERQRSERIAVGRPARHRAAAAGLSRDGRRCWPARRR